MPKPHAQAWSERAARGFDPFPQSSGVVEANKTVSMALATLINGLAELRNLHGTGHGKAAGGGEIGARQARLVVGAASTLCVCLSDTHAEIMP
ncbi:abortive infection family protein [Terriglobus roseus]|uniref:abortive infection family protein n=1 Tax=Terriglobus roseus TaxID=392734 RepID=UPI0009F6ADC0